jgi:hypothetical protein
MIVVLLLRYAEAMNMNKRVAILTVCLHFPTSSQESTATFFLNIKFDMNVRKNRSGAG